MTNLQQERAKLEGLLNNQIDPASGLAVNCRNCIHCDKDSLGSSFDRCLKCAGAYCELVHKFPSVHGYLCRNYSAWSPRQKSILELLSDRIRSILS
jgi:hypothetical protein